MDRLDMELFDQLRRLGRWMRMGRRPGMMVPPGMERGPMPFHQREIALIVLSDNPEGLRQKELAELFHVSPSTLSAMLGKLEEAAWVAGDTDPEDGRATRYRLTESGLARAEEIKRQHLEMIAGMFRNLEDDDKRELIRLLQKMQDKEE